jgi:O-antigen/teichoic acid export membrane protein
MRKLIALSLNTAKSFANPLFNFFIAIIGVHYFGTHNWGIIISILLWVYIISLISNWGNKEYLIRQFSKNSSKISLLFYSNLATRSFILIICGLLFLFFPLKTASYTTLLSLLIFFYSSLDSLVVYHQKFGHQLIAEILAFTTIILGVVYIKNFNTSSILLLLCVGVLVKIIYLSFFTLPHFLKKNMVINFNYYALGLPFFLIGFSGWLISKADVYIVSFFLEKDILASYQIFISAFLMLQAISVILINPFTKHLYRLPNITLKNIKNLLGLFSFPLSIIGSITIWYVLEWILHLKIKTCYYFLACISSLPSYFYIMNIYNLYKKNDEKKVMTINFVTGVSNLILAIILIQFYQVLGILISIIVTQILQLYLFKRYDRN